MFFFKYRLSSHGFYKLIIKFKRACKYLFFSIFVWKYDMIFYTFERFGCMHTHKTYFCIFLSEKISRQFFGISWNFSEKQELWYQVGILQYKFTTPIWSIKLRKTCEGPTNKLKMLHEFFWNFLRFFKGLFVRVLR